MRAALLPILIVVAFTLTGCGPAGSGPGRVTAPAAEPIPQARPLVMFIRAEPRNLAVRPFQTPAGSVTFAPRLFNATIALIDDKAEPRAQLVSSLPSLNSDTWRVLPDGPDRARNVVLRVSSAGLQVPPERFPDDV